jgi:hypothetical protein
MPRISHSLLFYHPKGKSKVLTSPMDSSQSSKMSTKCKANTLYPGIKTQNSAQNANKAFVFQNTTFTPHEEIMSSQAYLHNDINITAVDNISFVYVEASSIQLTERKSCVGHASSASDSRCRRNWRFKRIGLFANKWDHSQSLNCSRHSELLSTSFQTWTGSNWIVGCFYFL